MYIYISEAERVHLLVPSAVACGDASGLAEAVDQVLRLVSCEEQEPSPLTHHLPLPKIRHNKKNQEPEKSVKHRDLRVVHGVITTMPNALCSGTFLFCF